MPTTAHLKVIQKARALTSPQIDARVVPDAALGRTAGVVVPHAITGEDAEGAVVHPDGNRDLENLLGVLQPLDGFLIDIGVFKRPVQATDRVREGIVRGVGGHRGYSQGGEWITYVVSPLSFVL